MITEDFVSVEIQDLLNKKGFDFLSDSIQAIGMYDIKYNDAGNAELEKCCTYQMAMKWLREEHKVNIEIHYNRFGENYKYLIIYKPELLDDIRSLGAYYSYEEACEAAIKYCLEKLV